MSAPRRQGAVHRCNFASVAEELLKVAADERYREFLGQTDEISQLFYELPHNKQVDFVVKKLQTNPALAATVKNFIHQAGLQENKDAFSSAGRYL